VDGSFPVSMARMKAVLQLLSAQSMMTCGTPMPSCSRFSCFSSSVSWLLSSSAASAAAAAYKHQSLKHCFHQSLLAA